MACCRTDRCDDTFAYTGKDGLLAGTAHQLLDVGTHGYTGFGNQLNAVLRNGGDRRCVDNLGVDRRLHGFQHIATGEVDGCGRAEVEVHIGFVCRYESLDNAVYAASSQIVGLELILRYFEACLGCRHHIVHNHCRRNLTETHKNQLYQRGVYAADKGLEPDSDRHQPQEEYQKDDTRKDNYNCNGVHNLRFKRF